MARTREEHQRINHYLGTHGLGRLEDGAGLVAQLAFLVRSHEQLRAMLVTCEAEERREMYEALRPNLRFEAKPLDVYMAEAGQEAEARQLPVVGEDGMLHPYTPPEVGEAPKQLPPPLTPVERQIESQLNTMVEEAVLPRKVTVECRKCTRVERFRGVTRDDTMRALRGAGWVYLIDGKTGEGYEVCPQCAEGRFVN
jgi:hypothetical protein